MTKKQRNKKKLVHLVRQPNGRYAIYNLGIHAFIKSNIVMIEEGLRLMTELFGIFNPQLSKTLREAKAEVEFDFWVVCMEDLKSNFKSGLFIREHPEGLVLYQEVYKKHSIGIVGGLV